MLFIRVWPAFVLLVSAVLCRLLTVNCHAVQPSNKHVFSSKQTVGQNQWLKCKIKGGERYIQVWAPDNGRVLFPSIITI